MRSALRGTVVMVLLMILLAPGVARAWTPSWSGDWVSKNSPEIFLNKVWDLLASWWENSGSGAVSKNGEGLDPAGQPAPSPTTSGACDNGVGLDPAGGPCHL